MPDNIGNYGWLGLAAFCGVLARAARWTTADGKFDGRKAAFECLTAPAIGLMAGGLTRYFNPDMDPMILGAIAALLGLLGPAAIEAAALKWFDRKIGL
jgi:hypothetical protein